MKLSDYNGKYFKVLRDGVFEILGLLQGNFSKLSLAYVTSEKFLKKACDNPKISCIICSENLAGDKLLIDSGKGIAICEIPRAAFILLHNDLVQNCKEYNSDYSETKIGKNCEIHPTASIADKGVIIGNNVKIEEFAIIREGSQIGNNVIIRAGAVVGAENYDLCWDSNGCIIKMKEVGQIYIADSVEIGCYAIIGRAPFPYQKTVIGENTCVSETAIIGHNCQIGRNCLIAQALICGSVVVEDGVRINPGVTIKNAITIGKNAVVSLGSVVMGNVSEKTTVTGNCAIEHSKFLANHLQNLRNCI